MSHTNQEKGMLLARLLQKAMHYKNQNSKNISPNTISQKKLPNIVQNNTKQLSREMSLDSIDQSFFTARDDLSQMLKFIYIQLFTEQRYHRDLQRYSQIEVHPQKFKEAQDFNKEGKFMENIIFQIRQLKKNLIEANKQIKILKKIQREIQIEQRSSSDISKVNPQSSRTISIERKQRLIIQQSINSYKQKLDQLTLELNNKDIQIIRINHLHQKKIIKIEELEDALQKRQAQICKLAKFEQNQILKLNLQYKNLENSIMQQTDAKLVQSNSNGQNLINNRSNGSQIYNYQQKISLLKQELVQSKKANHIYQKQIQSHQTEIQKYQLFIGDLSSQIQICQQRLCSDKKELANKKVQTQCFYNQDIQSPNDMKNFQKYFNCPQSPNFRQTSIADLVEVNSQFQQSQYLARQNTFNDKNISNIQRRDIFSDKESITLSQFSQTQELRDIRNLTKQLSQAYDKIIALTYEVKNLKRQNQDIVNTQNKTASAFIKKDIAKDSQSLFKRLVKQK